MRPGLLIQVSAPSASTQPGDVVCTSGIPFGIAVTPTRADGTVMVRIGGEPSVTAGHLDAAAREALVAPSRWAPITPPEGTQPVGFYDTQSAFEQALRDEIIAAWLRR